jgi:glycine oxidase
VSAARSIDVAVIGAGLVGLAAAVALARRDARVLLLADIRRGEASPAAAGILSPSLEPASGAAHEFAVAARDHYPGYLDELGAETGVEVPLNRLGVLQLAVDAEDAARLEQSRPAGSSWLDRRELAEVEPGLAHAAGAVLHPHDGAVNNLVLMRALKTAVAHDGRVTVVSDAAEQLAFENRTTAVLTRDGARYPAARVVLASGAWAPFLEGLPRPLPIEPVRGQMMSVASKLLRHVVYAGDGYAVPRADGRTLIGSTAERVGFDASHTEAGVAEVRGIAAAISPQLAPARMLNAWAGLRPVTPDLQPIIGRDPERPSLIYACGHSRNGVLLAPLTGECVAALCAGEAPSYDLAPFRVERFAA